MKIGLTESSALAGGKDIIQSAVNFGVDGIEPFVLETDSGYFSWSKKECDVFKKKADDCNIAIPSIALGAFINNSSLVEKDNAKSAVEILKKSFDFCKSLGGSSILLCTYFASNPNSEEKRKALLDVINSVEPLARQQNITIALESPTPAADLVKMVEQINSKYFSVYFDVGNAIASGGNPVEDIAILKKHISNVHIKDSTGSTAGLHLDRGLLDLNAVLKSFNAIRYNSWFMLETPGDNKEEVEKDILILRNIIKETFVS
jgi:sugar phosphate isomerase/epimerase